MVSGAEIIPKMTVNRVHSQMQVNALSCKKEAMCEHDPGPQPSSLGQSPYKMDCDTVENYFVVRLVSVAKRRGTIRLYYQHSAEMPASLMV